MAAVNPRYPTINCQDLYDPTVTPIGRIYGTYPLQDEREILDIFEEADRKAKMEDPIKRYNIEVSQICKELHQYKKEVHADKMCRLQARANDPELRALQQRLLMATFMKQLCQQLRETDKRRTAEVQQRNREHKANLEKYASLTEIDLAKEQELAEANGIFRAKLREQMQERERRRLWELQSDKELCAIMAQMAKEKDTNESQAKWQMRQKFKRDWLETTKDYWERKHAAKIADYNEKVKAYEDQLLYQQILAERGKYHVEEKKRELLQKQAASEEMGKRTAALQKARLERQNYKFDLLVEEAKSNAIKKEIELLKQQKEAQRQLTAYWTAEAKARPHGAIEKHIAKSEENSAWTSYNEQRMAKENAQEQQKTVERQHAARKYASELLGMMEEKRASLINHRKRELFDDAVLSAQNEEQKKFNQSVRMDILRSIPQNEIRFLPSRTVTKSERLELDLTNELYAPRNCRLNVHLF